MGNDHGSGNFCNFSASLVGSEEVSKVFKPWEDARKRSSFLRNFEFRSDAGPGQAAAGSAAAFAKLGNQACMQAAAASVDLGDLVGAGPAAFFQGDLGRASAATDSVFSFNASHDAHAAVFSGDLGRAGAATEGNFFFNDLQGMPNSLGMGADAATVGASWAGAAIEGNFFFNALHGTINSLGLGADASVGAFRLHDDEGRGFAASVLGDTGRAFSCSDRLIRGSCSNSYHPIHACAHSCLDRCGVGVGVCGVGVACPVSSPCGPGVDDDGDDACMDGFNSLIQGSACHATACAWSDALHNSRRARGHCLRGGTKCTSIGTGAKVWLSDEIGGILSNQMSGSLHVEAWAGAQGCPPQEGFQVQGLSAGCASDPFFACCSDLDPVLPGPDIEIRSKLGWVRRENTCRSGVWFFRGAFQRDDLFSSLAETVDWEWKGSYRTVWAVLGGSPCSCSYAYGQGTAIGTHTGRRCGTLLLYLWRTYVAPLMKPWCAEGEVPTAANLNLYRGSNSRVNWHSDDEPLFGGSGVHKLIVSVSFGASVLFKWKGKSCLDSEERSCWLDHGDILVMDGQCQDEFLHCTCPGLERGRINVTYRWMKQHTHCCPFLKAGMVCCFPACAQGSSVHVTGNLGFGCFWAFLFLPCVLCMMGVFGWAFSLWLCTGLGFCGCAFSRSRSLDVSRVGYYLHDLGGDNWTAHNTVRLFWGLVCFILGLTVAWKLYMLALVGLPSLRGYDACMVFSAKGALWRNCRLKQCETSFSPFGVFLCSRYSLKRWWGKVLWLLWVGRARHPGPFSGSLSIEVFNIGGWLTHGDLALETTVDFLAVVEHRLVPARVRGEWARLRARGASSIWSPASQESSHVGHGGVGVVSLRGAPLSLPTSATVQFRRFF